MEKVAPRSPKSPLNNKGIRKNSRTRDVEDNSPALVLNDHLQNQIHDLLNNSGRRRQLSRRRRNRKRKTSTSGMMSSMHNVSTSDLDSSFHGDLNQSLNESRDLNASFLEETRALPEGVAPTKETQPPPSPSPSITSNKSFTSCYSTTGKTPNRLLLRLEAKQKKYQALSTKLIENERDLFETKTQLHDKMDENNELNGVLARREKKISNMRQELVERCEELNNLKNRLEKEASECSTLRQTLDQKEKMWRGNMMEVTKSNRQLLAQTIHDWEDKMKQKTDDLKRKDSQLSQHETRIRQVEEEVSACRKQLSEKQVKLDGKQGELSERIGELVALRKEKIELEKSVLCLSKHVDSERRTRIELEDRTKDYETLLGSMKMKNEEVKRLQTQLSQLRELREKEVFMIRRAMDRMTACSEMMNENLPRSLNRANGRNKKYDEDWNSLTDRSNVYLEELKKKLELYQQDDEREPLPKQTVGTNDYVNPFVQFCSAMYNVFKKLVTKQQDNNSISNCYVQKMKEKEKEDVERVKRERKRQQRGKTRMYLHQNMNYRY